MVPSIKRVEEVKAVAAYTGQAKAKVVVRKREKHLTFFKMSYETHFYHPLVKKAAGPFEAENRYVGREGRL